MKRKCKRVAELFTLRLITFAVVDSCVAHLQTSAVSYDVHVISYRPSPSS